MSKIGLIAAEGKMPVYIARGAKERGMEVYVAGLKGLAEKEDYADLAQDFAWLGLGQLSKGIEFFKKHGVTQICMAGRVRHTVVFSDLIPDLRTAKALAKLKDFKTETLLRAVMAEFEKDGQHFVSSASFLEHWLAKKGPMAKKTPSKEQQQTIDFGINAARALSALDIGLTAVLAGKSVVALEGMEGTDECILRAGELYKKTQRNKGSLTVVKAARPKQDFRFDLPVIGKGTIESMLKAGAGVLAVEAGTTLIIDMPEVIEMADKNKIVLTGF